MLKVLKFNNFLIESNYANEWPLTHQQIGLDDGDISSNPDFARSENKFQEIQDYMKIILKPIILRKNKNADDSDIEKVLNSFFNLGNNKSQEIKKMVDDCKDIKKCANDIINIYLKYVKINFSPKDNINDIEQDSVMSFEKFLNEGKASDVVQSGAYISYHNEIFPGYNYPKRYIGKGKYKYRVLAREGNVVKPINFGSLKPKIRPTNRLNKEFNPNNKPIYTHNKIW